VQVAEKEYVLKYKNKYIGVIADESMKNKFM